MIYVASRASIPERSAMWRQLRDDGAPIISSWIDEAGDGETGDFTHLWSRIHGEIAASDYLILYAEPGDFPLKGALIEAGMALGLGKPVRCVLPGVFVEGRTLKPVGSWMRHRLVTRHDSVADAMLRRAA